MFRTSGLRRLLWLITLVIYMAGLYIVSTSPSYGPKGDSLTLDVLHDFCHVPAYALLTIILLQIFFRFNAKPPFSQWVISLSMGYGILMEILQSLVPGRTPSVLDVALNALGTLVIIECVKKGILFHHQKI